MMQAAAFSRQELMITVIARLLAGCRLVATGASSPIPGAGALLARAQSGGSLRVNVLGSIRNDFLCAGGVEQIGSAECRARVCQCVSISVGAVPLKKKNNKK